MSTLDPTLSGPVGTTASDAVAAEHDVTVPIDAPPHAPLAIVEALTTSDHKVVGAILVGASAIGAMAVAVVAALLGVERIDGEGTLLDVDDLPELFAAYRVGLVEAVALPLLLGISVLVVPLQLGARALAFPRAAAAGMWAWLFGIVLVVIGLANGGGPGGDDRDVVELYLAGNVLALAGLTAVAATVATSVLTTRAPGMRLHRVPAFSWAALVGSLAIVLVLPVAAGAYILQHVDVRYGGPAFGGSAAIWPWTSYLYTGPVLGVLGVFAVGILAEVAAVSLRRRLPQRFLALTGLGLIGTAAFAGIAQQDIITLPGTGSAVQLSNIGTKAGLLANWALLTLLPVLGVVTVLGVVALAARPAKPRNARSTPRPVLLSPLLFAALGVILIVVGMLAAAVTGIEDFALEGTVFEEGAAVYVVYGTVLAGLGAVAYWFPKVSGRRMPELPLFGLALLGGLGGALASGPYLVAGFLDQPAQSPVWANDGPGELLNALVAIGHGLVGLTVLAVAGLAARTWRSGDVVGDDPWHGHTLEWATTSPAPAGNFPTTPTVMSPEPLLDLRARPDHAGETVAGTN